jgi:hypothetical protein
MQWFSLLVAMLMVGSIVGFTAFYQFPEPEQNPGPGPEEPPTTLDYTAEEVEATAVDMLPTLVIWGETSETDITAIDSSILALEGITRVRGKFVEGQSSLGTGYLYSAEIGFSSGLEAEDVAKMVEEKTSLENVLGVTYALVELPETIRLETVDETLGLSRDYNFSEGVTEAIVELWTREGDSLLVSVDATLVGNQASNIVVMEQENLTAKPVFQKAFLEAPVDSLEPELLFSAFFSYSQLDSLQGLEADINSLGGIEGSAVSVPEVLPKISLFGESVEETAFTELESFLQDLNAAVSLENDPLGGYAAFRAETTSQQFEEFVALVESKLADLNIEAEVFRESGNLSGTAEISSADSGQPGHALENLFEEKGLEFEIWQPGTASISEIKDENTVYSVNVPVQGFFKTGHSIGETVPLDVQYSLVRGGISSIQATEEES